MHKIMIQDSLKQLGIHGEELVARKLQNNGYTILERNYRKKYGEIDLIAQKGDVIAFVEVKMRRRQLFDLTMLITPGKQRKIIMVAKEFIARHRYARNVYQFDVAIVEATDKGPEICYIANAFVDERE